jgi:hypothetical protein
MVVVTNSTTVTTGGKWAKSEEIRFYSMECEDCCRRWPVHPASQK